MRTRMTGIIMLICIIVLTFIAFKGIKIGKIQILSIEQLKQKNDTLNEKIQEASNLTSDKYPENEEKLDETYNKYIIQKQKYEQLGGATNEDKKEIYETKQYDISYLWKVLGKYAKDRKLALGLDIQKNNFAENNYNINFTVSGEYVKVSQFITDIENDSDLYFRIYNFKMSGSEAGVTSTFTVKNVNIDSSTIK